MAREDNKREIVYEFGNLPLVHHRIAYDITFIFGSHTLQNEQ